MAFISASGSVSGWASLPADILAVIMDKYLVDISDRVRTGAVCKTWLSIFQEYQTYNTKRYSGQRQLPMLLIPTEDNSETHRGLYSVAERRILGAHLHVPHNKRCCGSSHGWLVFAEEDLSLTLFNPFSGETIRLPQVIPVPTKEEIGVSFYSPEYEIRKVLLSKDPSLFPDDYKVLAMCGFADSRRLGLFKAGGQSWIYTKDKDNRTTFSDSFQDITYFKGKFYAVNCRRLVRLVPKQSCIKLRNIILRKANSEESYVVGCGDSLLWIQRYFVQCQYRVDDETSSDDDETSSDDDDSEASNEDDIVAKEKTYKDLCDQVRAKFVRDGLGVESDTGYFEIDGGIYGYDSSIHHLTSSFKVYRISTKAGTVMAVKAKHLKGHALFLGDDNHTCSVLASDFPGCRPNCIYYTDGWLDGAYHPIGSHDIGVFSLEDKCARPLYVPGQSQWHLPPPIWIVPQANRSNMRPLTD